MATNASIITDVAKDITKRTVVDYGAGVFAHTTQDWARHNVVRLYGHNRFIQPGGEIAATESLRIIATRDDGSTLGQDLALVLPINPSSETALVNSPPIIIQQPADVTAPPQGTVQILVAAISDIPLTYQWQKLIGAVWTNLSGQTATKLVLTQVSAASDSGEYRVIVTNANGSTTSNAMTLSVVDGAVGSSSSGSPWYEPFIDPFFPFF